MGMKEIKKYETDLNTTYSKKNYDLSKEKTALETGKRDDIQQVRE